MIEAVSSERWAQAQQAEQSYWRELASDPIECVRVLREKVEIAHWVNARLPEGRTLRDAAEIGIGPLGMGCIHFFGAPEVSRVGVEPLELLDLARLNLPRPLLEMVRACRDATATYLRRPGEDTRLPSQSFDVVLSYNVLDHVRDPKAIIAEMHRLLRADGVLVIGCDTVSALSDLRFRWIKRRHPESVGVRAHPFRFRLRAVEQLVTDAGFRILSHNLPPRAPLGEVVGHAHRLLLLAERTA